MYKNIMFVCTGNSCRSPLAEGILREKVKDEDINVMSSGTYAMDGFQPAEKGIIVADKAGMDITDLRSTLLTKELMEENDIVFVMAEDHREYIKDFFPKYLDKVYLLRKFGRENKSVDDPDVKDPIGGTVEDYQECFDLIQAEIDRILPRITGKSET